jgi:hypothetical protein
MSENTLWSLSGVSPKGEPFVQLRMAESASPAPLPAAASEAIAQFTPAEARAFGQQVLECAEAAETDSFLWHFFTHVVKVDSGQVVAQLIVDFRNFRESRGGQKAPTRADFSGQQFEQQRKAAEKQAPETPDKISRPKE